jgi:hypothetical protein
MTRELLQSLLLTNVGLRNRIYVCASRDPALRAGIGDPRDPFDGAGGPSLAEIAPIKLAPRGCSGTLCGNSGFTGADRFATDRRVKSKATG